jgi:hypothetical protein
MRRMTLGILAALLALPATAMASSGHGVVLSVDSRHKTVQVVDGSHVVHAYKYRGRLPRLHVGSSISFKRSGKAISGVKAGMGVSRTVSFYGRVTRSSRSGLVLRLADGRTVSFSAKQVRHQRPKPAQRHKRHARVALMKLALATLTINIQGLAPGVVVLITETVDEHGNVTITIAFPPHSDPVVGGEQHASGTVDDVGEDTFLLTTDDGSDLRLHMAKAKLADLGLQPCDTADISYHQDAGMLIADTVTPTGTSDTGDCASGQDEQDATGAITQVSGDRITIATQDQGAMSFTVDSADVTDGFLVGDVVDVTYVDTGSGLDASDVEYVEQDLSGTVTSVNDGSLTITDDSSGHSVTFSADPGSGTFDGVALGDPVDVNYHQSGGRLIADSVDDANDSSGSQD